MVSNAQQNLMMWFIFSRFWGFEDIHKQNQFTAQGTIYTMQLSVEDFHYVDINHCQQGGKKGQSSTLISIKEYEQLKL